MKKTIYTVKVFGVYTLIMGCILLFLPGYVLPLFGLPVGESPVWTRLLGFVLCCSGYYYIRSALAGNIDFARYTVHTRFLAPAVVVFLILSGEADWHFLSFGLVDGLGGLWTWLSIRNYLRHRAGLRTDVLTQS
jgi:hypothetical protein